MCSHDQFSWAKSDCLSSEGDNSDPTRRLVSLIAFAFFQGKTNQQEFLELETIVSFFSLVSLSFPCSMFLSMPGAVLREVKRKSRLHLKAFSFRFYQNWGRPCLAGFGDLAFFFCTSHDMESWNCGGKALHVVGEEPQGLHAAGSIVNVVCLSCSLWRQWYLNQ